MGIQLSGVSKGSRGQEFAQAQIPEEWNTQWETVYTDIALVSFLHYSAMQFLFIYFIFHFFSICIGQFVNVKQ